MSGSECHALRAGERRLLEVVIAAGEGGIARDSLAAAVQMTASSGTFVTYLSTVNNNRRTAPARACIVVHRSAPSWAERSMKLTKQKNVYSKCSARSSIQWTGSSRARSKSSTTRTNTEGECLMRFERPR
jgi:hypothetical protein